MARLTDEQKQEIMTAIEGIYGDDKEALRSALRDIIAEAGPAVVKAFLRENTQGTEPSDYVDRNVYHRIQRLIESL